MRNRRGTARLRKVLRVMRDECVTSTSDALGCNAFVHLKENCIADAVALTMKGGPLVDGAPRGLKKNALIDLDDL